jgi:hypothetical protein
MRLADLALGRRGDESAIDLRRALAALADLASSCSTLANANRSEEIHVDARSSTQSRLGRYEQWTASSWLQIPVRSGARLRRWPIATQPLHGLMVVIDCSCWCPHGQPPAMFQ